ncbi:MAG: hypothetical protein WBW61_00140, partial [Rhodanobacteraceae bacterium]
APNGYGGGIEVLGPARADIGSPGYNGSAVIQFNDAQYGGGIAALAVNDSDQDAIVRVFTTDANNPVQIADNGASATGGGVYLKPNSGSSSGSTLCAYDFRMHDNVAQEGAAIYADEDFDGFTFIGDTVAINIATFSECVTPEAPPALGAVACAAGVPCNEIKGNVAADATGQPTAGSTILVQSGGTLDADRFSMRGNSGAHVLRQVSDAPGHVGLRNCLLAGNTLTQELIAKTDGNDAYLGIDSCTIAGDQIGAPYAFLAPGSFGLRNSIIDQPGTATVDPAITDPNSVAYVLTNDGSTLPDTVYVQEGEPTFVDPANGDYHLVPTSLGVDSAPMETNGTPTDLDRKRRVVDLPNVPDNFGPMDLGAYEIQLDTVLGCANADTIFCDGFEGQ